MTELDLDALDVGYAALFAGYAYAEAVMVRVSEQGYAGIHFAQGFFIQHLIEAEPTIGEMARAQGVSPQAISQMADELIALGYVERRADVADGRRRRLALTPRGREMVEATRAARRVVEASLARRIGRARLDAAAATMREAIAILGGAEAIRARRVRAPR